MRIEVILTYAYDNSGRLAKTVDSGSGITTTYYYDLIDRLVGEKKTGGDFVRDDYDDSWTIKSTSAYFMAGISVRIGFDMISFCQEIDAIYFLP
ncbi:MAG: RHS repeat protein [Oscillospiraceae bacterium]|nr:RHS repeat protein [Oscillospiraceae bacterium]